MNKEVIFPIAKLLKEKGFDEISQKWYSVEGGLYYQDEFDNNRGFIPAYECEAPTIDDVKWWFYQKHGIWIYVDSHEFGKWCYNHKYIRPHKLNPIITENGHFGLDDYNTPKESYEAAFEYASNNLI